MWWVELGSPWARSSSTSNFWRIVGLVNKIKGLSQKFSQKWGLMLRETLCEEVELAVPWNMTYMVVSHYSKSCSAGCSWYTGQTRSSCPPWWKSKEYLYHLYISISFKAFQTSPGVKRTTFQSLGAFHFYRKIVTDNQSEAEGDRSVPPLCGSSSPSTAILHRHHRDTSFAI